MEEDSVVFLATASYGSLVHADYMFGCLDAIRVFGDRVTFPVIRRGVYVEENRDYLTKAFVDSNATHLLFVDTDIGWRAVHLQNLLEAQKDVISGTYRRKTDRGTLASHQGDLEQCVSLPAGFLLITRGAVLRAMAAMPNDVYEIDGKTVTALWHPRFCPRAPSYRDDAAFSKHCRDAGIELWRHKEVVLTHYGEKGYRP
jgi:hypothetical protein